MKIVFIAFAALSMPVSAIAQPTFAKGVAVECAPLKVVRLLPADEEKLGRRYAELTARELEAAMATANAIFSSPTTEVASVPAAFFGDPDANGDHWKKEGNWPGQALRAQTGPCSVSTAVSLGRNGSTSYAFVPVSCQTGKAPWTDIRLGVQLLDGKVATVCANVGSFTTVKLAPQERG